MSDHMLSQEEVDALLRGEGSGPSEPLPDLDEVVNLFQGALERVAPLASPIAGKQLKTGTVTAEFLPWGELRAQLITPLIAIWRYSGALNGSQMSIADGTSRQQSHASLAEEDPATLLNKLALALAQGLEQSIGVQLDPDIESYRDIDLEHHDDVPLQDDDVCIVLQMGLRGPNEDVSWLEVLPVKLAGDMIEAAADTAGRSSGSGSGAAAEQHETVMQTAAARVDVGPVTIAPAEFAQLAPGPSVAAPANIGLIMDVPLHVTVELGRRRMLVREVLDLGKGSLIELDKLAGEPVDVFVNGKLIAKGEVVVIDENFGVKVKNIVTPVERVRNLQ